MPASVSESEYIRRIKDASSGRYELVGFVGDFSGNSTRCMCRCLIDGNEWSTTTIKQLIRGAGCPLCGGVKRWSKDEYAERINKASLGRHSFSRWDGSFKNKSSKAICVCSSCSGEFLSRVDNLISRGTSCPSCQRKNANNKCSVTKMLTEQQVRESIEKAIGNEIEFIGFHGDMAGSRTICKFFCRVHDVSFMLMAMKVTSKGQRCPLCNSTGFNMSAKGFVYALRSEDGQHLKVGISNKPEQRIAQLSSATPFGFNVIEIVEFEKGRDAYDMEQKIQKGYIKSNLSGFDGCTEWLKFNADILSEITSGH